MAMPQQTPSIPPDLMAAKLLARVLHDIAGPMSGLTTALELLGESHDPTLHAEALSLAREGLEQMSARIAFSRAAFAGAGGQHGVALEHLLEAPFKGSRARLEPACIPPGVPAVMIQGMMIVLQIAAEALGAGGVARLSFTACDEGWRGRVEAEGRRAQLHPETMAGLQGGGLASGLPGRWAPAAYLHALSSSAQGAISFGASEGQFWLAFTCPG